MLIDRKLYDRYHLDEEFEWWWSVTKLESQVLKEGYQIIAVINHESYLHHYGGASGKDFSKAKGMDLKIQEVMKWFEDSSGSVQIIEKLD